MEQLTNHSQKEIAKQPFLFSGLYEVYELSKSFYSGPPMVRQYLEHEIQNICAIIHQSIGDKYLGGFGLGYPFYVLKNDGALAHIYEIESFIDKQTNKLRSGQPIEDEWVCTSCQTKNKLPDLKTMCKSCDLTHVKPRDVLKTIPDIDQLTIVSDDTSQEDLLRIQSALKEGGYTQSDVSIEKSLIETRDVLLDLSHGENPKAKLPIDLHVLKISDLRASLQEIKKGGEPIIKTDSLRTTWEKYDLPIWFDFIFSAKEIGYLHQDLIQDIEQTRSFIKKNFSVDDLIERIKNFSPRVQGIFNNSDVENILREKIKNW